VTVSARRSGPRKSLGQHFLSDSRVVSRIIGAAELSPLDTVVEIGPGRGVLTRRLVQEAGLVVALELDARLWEDLPSRLGFPSNLRCILADAREADLPALVSSPSVGTPGRYKVIGNLPYYAANRIVRRVLESVPPPSMVLVMVQKEVAESMTASPGDMSLLSVATQCYADARLVCSVPPSAFRPPPKVRSAVVRLDVREIPSVDSANRDVFFEVVRAGFSAPRKQIHNSLSHGLGIEPGTGTAILERAGIDGRRRPATLNLEEWGAVLASWQETGQGMDHRAD
jgi:16S rRNA (adenine1518-N6/adenine1519-N6)-dimethyltransferase